MTGPLQEIEDARPAAVTSRRPNRQVTMNAARRRITALLLLAGTTAADAKDLSVIADFVKPAYRAMFLTVLCSRNEPSFLALTSGPRGNALNYAEHVKDEAIAGLTEEEAVAVLKLAADDGRALARDRLYRLADPADDRATAVAIRKWCDGEGKALVVETLGAHDRNHAELLGQLDRAKR